MAIRFLECPKTIKISYVNKDICVGSGIRHFFCVKAVGGGGLYLFGSAFCQEFLKTWSRSQPRSLLVTNLSGLLYCKPWLSLSLLRAGIGVSPVLMESTDIHRNNSGKLIRRLPSGRMESSFLDGRSFRQKIPASAVFSFSSSVIFQTN